jgi:hypothetical protein
LASGISRSIAQRSIRSAGQGRVELASVRSACLVILNAPVVRARCPPASSSGAGARQQPG